MLIIFDCDGVLVDSEPLAARVFARYLNAFGISLSAQECESKFRGHTMDYCLSMLHREHPGKLPSGFLDGLAKETEHAFGVDLKPVAGVSQVLDWLRVRDIRFCVASNGALAKVRHSLRVTGLMDYFDDRCFSAEQVARGKPDPDLFLLAAATMGAGAAHTLVIEDSIAGVTAAMRAGMHVLRYGEPVECEGQCVESFMTMGELPALIEGKLKALIPPGG